MKEIRASAHRVRIGSRWQITIPREIRERFGIRPGQTLWMSASHGAIQIFVERPPDEPEATAPKDA